MILFLVFIIVLPIALVYNFKNPPMEYQCYRRKQKRKALYQTLGVAAVTTCVKLMKDK